MPANLLNADVGFPQLREGQNSDEKIDRIVDYLYMLLEQLRYSFGNVDKDNFSENGLKELEHLFTDPVYMRLENSEGSIASLSLTAEGLSTRMSNAEGNISTLTQTAASLTTRISDAEGNISSLTQTSESFETRLTSAEGNLSTISQTVNSITLSVTNGTTSSSISLLRNGVAVSSQNISFSGYVTFTSLATAGSTTIDGGNITTGTISAINISGCTIAGSLFRSILDYNGTISGRLSMCYLNEAYEAGGIRLDDQGAGTDTEARYRMFIYTKQVGGVAFAMKLQSAGGVSIKAGANVYISAETAVTIAAATNLNLTGKHIYANGKEIGT